MLTGDSQDSIPVSRLEGKNVNIVAFNMDRHLQPLWEAQTGYKRAMQTQEDLIFTYLMYGPFSTMEDFKDGYLNRIKEKGLDQYVVEYNGNNSSPPVIVGGIAFMAIRPEDRTCEIGNIWLDPRYRRKNIMDEAVYLMLQHAFEFAKYRRVQWTCNNLNEPSKKMALRNQFEFEGVLRNFYIAKGCK